MNITGSLAWLIVGAITGWLANTIMKTNHERGLLLDIIVALVGAFIGGLMFNAGAQIGVTDFNIWSLFAAFVGAIILLALLRLEPTLHRPKPDKNS